MTKVMSAEAASALVRDGATVLIDGSGGGVNEPGLVLAALESRFAREHHPAELTVVHPSGVGDGQGGGIDRFAHKGMASRAIGGHWNWAPRMQRMALSEEIEAYCLPQGVLSHLFRAIAGHAPGVITHIGLGTFVDPRTPGPARTGPGSRSRARGRPASPCTRRRTSPPARRSSALRRAGRCAGSRCRRPCRRSAARAATTPAVRACCAGRTWCAAALRSRSWD